MFGSTVLDVAVGLVFLFLAVSLAASAVTEAIASAVKLRQKTLRSGIGALLNDPDFTGLALQLYNHALVNPLAQGTASSLKDLTRNPAYISSRNFALALLHALANPPPAKDPNEAPPPPANDPNGASAAPQVQADARVQADPPVQVDPTAPAAAQVPADPQLQAELQKTADQPVQAEPQKTLAQIIGEVPDDQLKQVLATLYQHAAGDRAEFVAAVGAWFDDAMDRVSGWYKRYTQAISVAVALIVCIILNADALRIGDTLWHHPALTAELQVHNDVQVGTAIHALDVAGLLGWAPSNYADPRVDFVGFLLMILGWLIVAGASMFGAPFWFDTLQRFVQLAGTGPATPTDATRSLPSA